MKSELDMETWIATFIHLQWNKIKSTFGQARMPGKRRRVPKTLGCGSYGCVFDTNTPDIVLKATFDVLEGRFVAYAISLGEFPPGIVRYYDLLEHPHLVVDDDIDTSQPDDQDVTLYLLWRERAIFGNRFKLPEQHKLSSTEFQRVGLVHAKAELLYDKMRALYRHQAARHLPAARRQIQIYQPSNTDLGYLVSPEAAIESVAHALGEYETLLRDPRQPERLKPLFEALSFYLERGFLLSDARPYNVAPVERDGEIIFALVDPGLALDFRSAL
jgi:hypothetical protein